MPQKPSVRRTCECCETEFLIRPVDAKRGKGRFCSHSCSSKVVSTQYLTFGETGAANPAWKGGLTRSTKGYWYVLDRAHSRAMSNGYVKRATLVLERKLGRHLTDDEFAHHDNENKEDDSPGNLILMKSPRHNRIHHAKKR